MRIKWVGEVAVPKEKTASNVANCKALALPYISERERPRLAVVGGAPSVECFADELREWDGDIWASGSAYPWARNNGINAAFFTIDQSEIMGAHAIGANRAVVATCCDPSVFESLRGAQVEVFDLQHEGEDANHGATGVTAAPKIALLMGYREIHFFGCDSSYENGRTHAYQGEPGTQYPITVSCGGGDYETGADMLMQAEFMALVIRSAPSVFVNRSRGLLAAMVKAEPELNYEIIRWDSALQQAIDQQEKLE